MNRRAGLHFVLALFVVMAGCTAPAATPVEVLVALSPNVDLDTVNLQGTILPNATWGSWTVETGATAVASTNYLKITNRAPVGTRVVVDFSDTKFTGATDPLHSVPITNNLDFAWFETTASNATPASGTFTFAAGTPGVTVTFSQANSIIFLTYRIVQMPAVLPVQAYSAPFTATPLEAEPPPTVPVADPGRSYHDIGCDGLFHPGVDTTIPNATIHSGSYDSGDAHCLVVTTSVGTVSAQTIDYKAGGITIRTTLNATGGQAKLTATSGSIDATGRSVTARDDVVLNAGSSPLWLTDSTLRSATSAVKLEGNGPINGARATLTAHSDVLISTRTSAIDLNNARANATTGKVSIVTAGVRIDLTSAVLWAGGDVDVRSAGGVIDLTSARATSTSAKIFVDSGIGNLTASRLTATAATSIDLVGSGASRIRVGNATLTAQSGRLLISSPSGTANAPSLIATAGAALGIVADGDLLLDAAKLTATSHITVDLRSNKNTAYVQAAEFRDPDNYAELSPKSAKTVGTPAFGGIGR